MDGQLVGGGSRNPPPIAQAIGATDQDRPQTMSLRTCGRVHAAAIYSRGIGWTERCRQWPFDLRTVAGHAAV